MSIEEFVDLLMNEHHVGDFVGVSDSTLSALIKYLSEKGLYTPFTNEGDAVAYAAGRYATGKITAVLMQNSGVTNASSPISSLTSVYDIPLVTVVGARGGPNDEPQHEIVGKTCISFLSSIAPLEIYDTTIEGMSRSRKHNPHNLNKGLIKLFYVTSDTFRKDNEESQSRLTTCNTTPRQEIMRVVKDLLDNTKPGQFKYLATTGHTGRELMRLTNGDTKDCFYMVGSMGCIASFGAGISQSHKCIIFDGDGSVLMRPEGTLLMNELCSNQVIHIIFNNRCHLSTGGQKLPDLDDIMRSDLTLEYDYSPEFFDTLRDLVADLTSHEYNNYTSISIRVPAVKGSRLPRPSKSCPEMLKDFMENL